MNSNSGLNDNSDTTTNLLLSTMWKLIVEMTSEPRFPIKMPKLANKKNHISFGKANPMQKVSLVTGNLLNNRPLPQKRIGIFTQHFKLVPSSNPTEKLNEIFYGHCRVSNKENLPNIDAFWWLILDIDWFAQKTEMSSITGFFCSRSCSFLNKRPCKINL